MTFLRSTFFVLIALLSMPLCFCQTKTIEALKQNIEASKTKQEKMNNIFLLCDIGYTLHADTVMKYAALGRALAEELKDKDGIVKAMYYDAGALTTRGRLDTALSICDECLKILSTDVKDPELEANIYNQKGRCFVRKNQYKEAIDMAYKTITVAEKISNVLLQVKGKTLIGWAYLEMGQNREALNWHLKAIQTTSDTLLLEKYAILFGNIATNYNNLGMPDSAFYYIDKGIAYARKHENLFALSNCLAIQSELFVKAGKAKLSEPVLKEVIAIRKIIGDPFYIASDMSQLGFYYAHYGQPEKGIEICKEGIAIAKQYHLDTKLLFLYNSLADNYKALGKSNEYAAVLNDIIDLKDSIYQKNSSSDLAELQASYDLQKKENVIIQQKLDINTKNYLFYGALAVLFFAALVSLLLFREYQRRQKIKVLKMQEEEKLLSVVAITRAEENERKRIAADLHDNLGAYAASIVSNLDQISLESLSEKAAIPLQELRNNSQSIVAQLGDTIWALKKDALHLTAISDRLKIFIQRLQPSYPLVEMDVEENILSDLLVPPVQAFHLFSILQEAIINALKHSRCKRIIVLITSTEQWKITVKDDGVGIDEAVVNTSNNGVANMQKRAADFGWHITWKNMQPGTDVDIYPTTN